MIHDHAATIATIRAGGFVDQGPLLALCNHVEALEREAEAARQLRARYAAGGRKGGSRKTEAKTRANRLNGRKATDAAKAPAE